MPKIDIDRLAHRIREVSTLPHILTETIAITNNPKANVDDLTEVIKTDPALTVRVLKCVNSAAHGLQSRVSNLQQAVGYLGFRQVRNLTIAASVCEAFKQDLNVGPYHRVALWHHLVAVAVTARMIAIRKSLANPDDLFLVGLLHDLGIILEDQYLNADFVEMMGSLTPDDTLLSAERQHLGTNHVDLGTKIARDWKLPPLVQEAIAHHHNADYQGPHPKTIACVRLANMMCTSIGLASTKMGIEPLDPNVLITLEIAREDIKPLIEQMRQQVDQNKELMDMMAAA